MINMELEKNSALTAKDVNSLLAFAVGEAETDGFLDRFVFERAAYTYLYVLLSEEDERKEILDSINDVGVLETWQALVASGKIDEMLGKHAVEVEQVTKASDAIFDDYSDYAKSIRAALINMQAISNNVMRNAMQEMSKNMSSEQYQDIMSIAEKWGMTNQ